MKTRYRLFRRGNRGGAFYCLDTKTGKRASLQTSNEDEARQIIEARNQAERQPMLKLGIQPVTASVKQKWFGKGGESADHKALKQYLRSHPEIVGATAE